MAKLTAQGLAFSEVIIEVFRVNGLALDAGDQLTQPLGLTSARWQVMGSIGHAPAPVAHIARSMGLTRQSVRETAEALVQAGFARYADNPHHRTAKLLALTEEGQRTLRDIEQHHAVWANRIGRRIDLNGLRAVVLELQRVRELLERDGETASDPRARSSTTRRKAKV